MMKVLMDRNAYPGASCVKYLSHRYLEILYSVFPNPHDVSMGNIAISASSEVPIPSCGEEKLYR